MKTGSLFVAGKSLSDQDEKTRTMSEQEAK